MKIKYKITNLSTEILEQIVQDNYRRFITNDVRDYWDQKDDILTLLYTRRCKQQEQELKQRDLELLRFERLEFLRSLVPLLGTKFSKVKSECIMLIYIELEKLGLTEFDLYEEY